MTSRGDAIVYIASQLPKRSETFVYREVLGLRDRGWRVIPASVHKPERSLGDPELDQLAQDAVVVYGAQMITLGMRSALRRPDVLLLGLRDALSERDLPGAKRLKLLVQCWGGLALAARLRRQGVRHVHAHMAHVPTSVAMYAARALGVPFSFTGHAADLFRDRSMLTAKLSRAAFVNCISEWHRGWYQAQLKADGRAPLPEESLPVVRCGVDVAEFAPRPRAVQAGPMQALAVGRLVPKKGFDVLLEAWARMLREAEEPAQATLHIVGDGPQRAELEAQLRALKLEQHVKLLGALSNDAVREWMLSADVFVLPCRPAQDGDKDGIPVVLMEAMACGLCVISGDLPAIRELVVSGETGMMVAPGDAAQLCQRLVDVLSDQALRRRLGDYGRRRVCEEFALSVNLERIEAALSMAAEGLVR